MRKYFYTDGVNKLGPYSKDELKSQAITRSTKIWYFGSENWTELYKVKELNDIFLSIPPDLIPQKVFTQKKKENVFSKTIRKSTPVHLKSKITRIGKWLIAIVILFMVTIVIVKQVQKQLDANLRKEIIKNSYETDEKFDIYIEKFYRDLELYGIIPKKPKKTIIRFSSLDQLDKTTHIHGLSLGYDDDSQIEIYINPSSWKKFNKPMRYFLMYHELAHDVLNLDDLDKKKINEGKLMFPEISSYDKKNMDDFIESFHALFEEQSKK